MFAAVRYVFAISKLKAYILPLLEGSNAKITLGSASLFLGNSTFPHQKWHNNLMQSSVSYSLVEFFSNLYVWMLITIVSSQLPSYLVFFCLNWLQDFSKHNALFTLKCCCFHKMSIPYIALFFIWRVSIKIWNIASKWLSLWHNTRQLKELSIQHFSLLMGFLLFRNSFTIKSYLLDLLIMSHCIL